MDKTLIDYDKNLEELERQREKLQKVMQMMGQEWEESGAGIGWLGQVEHLSTSTITKNMDRTKEELNNTETQVTDKDILSISNPPLFTNILSSQSSPSPEYLQSLLNVNEALLAQSLSTPIPQTITNTPPMLTHSSTTEEQFTTPLVTPDDGDLKNKNNTPSNYINSDLISPLSDTSFHYLK